MADLRSTPGRPSRRQHQPGSRRSSGRTRAGNGPGGGAGCGSRWGPRRPAQGRPSPALTGAGAAAGSPAPPALPPPGFGAGMTAGARAGRAARPRPRRRTGPTRGVRTAGRCPSPGGMGHCPLAADRIHEQQAATDSQTSVSVGHTASGIGAAFDMPHLTRRFPNVNKPASQPRGRVRVRRGRVTWPPG